MKLTFNVLIRYTNGSFDTKPFVNYLDALDFCRNGISYSGGRVKRVEILGYSSSQAMWDISWDDESKRRGLRI